LRCYGATKGLRFGFLKLHKAPDTRLILKSIYFRRMRTTKNKRELKKGTSIALTPSLKTEAEKWAKQNKISLSAILSASLEILLGAPLGRKELIVEDALRKALNKAPSASFAQILRRLDTLEAEVKLHRRPYCQGYCLPERVAKEKGLADAAELEPTQPVPLGAVQ
jgi:hypothetical protein